MTTTFEKEKLERPLWPKNIRVLGTLMPVIDGAEFEERKAGLQWFKMRRWITLQQPPEMKNMGWFFSRKAQRKFELLCDDVRQRNNVIIGANKAAMKEQLSYITGCPPEAVSIDVEFTPDCRFCDLRGEAPAYVWDNPETQ